jgi:hypothetical protein
MPDMRGFRDYLRYAGKYLAVAEEAVQKHEDTDWLLIPAIILAWSAVESFVNNRCDDLSSLPADMFELHERAFLLERRLRFIESGANIGKFDLEGSEYQALENKIFFLLSKMGSRSAGTLKGEGIWTRFQSFKDARNNLVHPRKDKEIILEIQNVEEHIETARELIQMISKKIWKTRLDL